MDLRALRYFDEVVRSGGFTRAAEILHVTQPTISKMVRQLEDELGVSLLVRGPRAVRVTEAGAMVVRYAQQILRQCADLQAELDGLKGLVRGELRLGLPPLFGVSQLTGEIGRFHRLHPGINLTISEHGGMATIDKVQAGELDVGVTPSVIDSTQLDQLTLYSGRLVLIVPRNSRWAGQTCRLADLSEEAFVSYPDNYSRLFAESCG
jgi:DNA-binding transcriptional LysR family regulator